MTHPLDRAEVERFWREDVSDTPMYPIIALMESCESWVMDGDPSVEESLQIMTEAFTNLANRQTAQAAIFRKREEFIRLLNQLSMGRVLRALKLLDDIQPSAAAELMVYAEERTEEANDAFDFFIKRQTAFERLRLMTRLLQKSRFEEATHSLSGEEQSHHDI